MKKQVVLKFLIAGDASVGKTTLVHGFVDGVFIENTTMTVAVEFRMKDIQVRDVKCQLQLWDIGGQERFRFMVEKYIPGAQGALLLYDITNMKSFVNIEKWTQIVRMHDNELPIVLVSTKYDLEEFTMIGDFYPEKTKRRFKMIDYVKTSSKLGLNVDKVFEILATHIVNNSEL